MPGDNTVSVDLARVRLAAYAGHPGSIEALRGRGMRPPKIPDDLVPWVTGVDNVFTAGQAHYRLEALQVVAITAASSAIEKVPSTVRLRLEEVLTALKRHLRGGSVKVAALSESVTRFKGSNSSERATRAVVAAANTLLQPKLALKHTLGAVEVAATMTSPGPLLHTIQTAVAAHALKLPVERIRLVHEPKRGSPPPPAPTLAAHAPTKVASRSAPAVSAQKVTPGGSVERAHLASPPTKPPPNPAPAKTAPGKSALSDLPPYVEKLRCDLRGLPEPAERAKARAVLCDWITGLSRWGRSALSRVAYVSARVAATNGVSEGDAALDGVLRAVADWIRVNAHPPGEGFPGSKAAVNKALAQLGGSRDPVELVGRVATGVVLGKQARLVDEALAAADEALRVVSVAFLAETLADTMLSWASGKETIGTAQDTPARYRPRQCGSDGGEDGGRVTNEEVASTRPGSGRLRAEVRGRLAAVAGDVETLRLLRNQGHPISDPAPAFEPWLQVLAGVGGRVAVVRAALSAAQLVAAHGDALAHEIAALRVVEQWGSENAQEPGEEGTGSAQAVLASKRPLLKTMTSATSRVVIDLIDCVTSRPEKTSSKAMKVIAAASQLVPVERVRAEIARSLIVWATGAAPSQVMLGNGAIVAVGAPQPASPDVCQPSEMVAQSPISSNAPAPGAAKVVERVSAPAAAQAADPLPGAGDGENKAPPTTATTTVLSVTERWVMEQALRDPERVRHVHSELVRAVTAVAHTQAPSTSSELLDCLRAIDSAKAALERAVTELPPADEVTSKETRARQALERVMKRLTSTQAEALLQASPPPGINDVNELAETVEDEPFVSSLPGWLWSALGGPEQPEENLKWTVLAASSHRALVQRLRSLVDPQDEAQLKLLATVPSPPPEADVVGHVERSLRELREANDELHSLRASVPWIDAAIQAGAKPAAIREPLRRILALRPKLSEQTFGLAVQGAGDAAADLEQYATRLEEAIHQLESFFRSAPTFVPWDVLRAKMAEVATTTIDRPRFSIERDEIVEGGHARSVPLEFSARTDEPREGHVTLPLRLRADVALALDLEISIDPEVPEYETKHRWRLPPIPGVRPHGQPAIPPGPSRVTVDESQWRPWAWKPGFVYTFLLTIPVMRPPEDYDVPLKLAVSAKDQATGATSHLDLQWKKVEVRTSPIECQWSERTVASYAQEHPIGPQKHKASILGKIRDGSSFAVVAPRRFGKTTLIEALLHEVRSREDLKGEVLALDPVSCTSHFQNERLEHASLWTEVSERCRQAIGSHLKLSLVSDLPTPDAFDSVREHARRAGRRTILILFDEAQLLFSRQQGAEQGNRIKDLLEKHWCRQTESQANVMFGFVGLPPLQRNMGTNFESYLSVHSDTSITSDDLRMVLAAVTKRQFHTTREAREHLIARSSGNLLVLKILSEQLVDLVNRDGRCWANYDDVAQVVQDVRRRLQSGQEAKLGRYLQDALNESEDVNVFRPISAYPLALALATAQTEGRRPLAGGRERARELLRSWSAKLDDEPEARPLGPIGSETTHLEYRADEEYGALVERDLISNDGFRSDLLAAWLAHAARTFPRDSFEKEALFRGCLQRVRVPAQATLVSEGSQARLFRFQDRTGLWHAVRRVVLATEKDRDRFLEAARILARLRRDLSGQEHARYVFVLESVGLEDGDDRMGVQIYRWIEGVSLEERRRAVPAALVADLGVRLAETLVYLHENLGVLHRDISPRNIIFDDILANPVLIDFGLARARTEVMGTRLHNEEAAPEVQGARPVWDKPADVFALARTLLALVDPLSPGRDELQRLLAPYTSNNPVERPTARVLSHDLKALWGRLRVQETLSRKWDDILDLAAPDLRQRWFVDVLHKHRHHCEQLALGMYPQALERAAEIAVVLNQVLEYWSEQDPDRRQREAGLTYSLGEAKNDRGGPLAGKPAIDFLHYLRNERSHANRRYSLEQARRRFRGPTDDQIRAWVLEGGELIGRCVGVSSLAAIVKVLISGSS